MNKKSIQDALLSAIQTIVDNKLNKLKFNYYIDATICNVNQDDTYNIMHNNFVYKNIPAFRKGVFKVGDVVQVLVKNGDWNKKFIDDLSNHSYIESAPAPTPTPEPEPEPEPTPTTDAADIVIEQGESGVWTYRKWESGIYECWTRQSFSGFEVSTAWGSLYVSGVIESTNLQYPTDAFIEPPMLNVNLVKDSYGLILMVSGNGVQSTETQTGCFEVVRGTQYTDTSTLSITLNYHAIGKWK